MPLQLINPDDTFIDIKEGHTKVMNEMGDTLFSTTLPIKSDAEKDELIRVANIGFRYGHESGQRRLRTAIKELIGITI